MKTDIKQAEKVRYLSQYRDIMLEIDLMEERLARLDDQITSLKSPVISDMPKGGGQSMQDIIARKIDLFNDINRKLIYAHEAAECIKDAIARMDLRLDRLLLEMRHIDCMTYEEMAERLAKVRHDQTPYSIKHTKRLYWAAVDRFAIP